MYCKFCGNRVDSETDKCTVCGASIDFYDGGQSYFEDNELDEWKDYDVIQKNHTYVPKTEMKFHEQPKGYLNAMQQSCEVGEMRHMRSSSLSSEESYTHRRKKSNKKNELVNFKLLGSNALIFFCIASALAIVLLTVAIVAVLRDNDNTSGDEVNQDVTSEYIQQGENEQGEDANVYRNMSEIPDIKILDSEGKEISYSVSAFISENNILYISLDRILKHEGYKNGRSNGNDSNRVIYEHKTSGKVIEIEKGTNKIWITEKGEEPIVKYLESENFNVKDDTYVPIKSFLTELGYDAERVVLEENTLYFNR